MDTCVCMVNSTWQMASQLSELAGLKQRQNLRDVMLLKPLTLDLRPSRVSVVHVTQIRTYSLPLKPKDRKSKQLQTLTFSAESPLFFMLVT